jgi:hypothetical protein
MKKSLLFVALAFASVTFAQNGKYVMKRPPLFVNELENVNQKNTTPDNTQTVSTCDSLGGAVNAFGGYTRSSRSIIYADPNLNSIILVHRGNPGSNDYMYDFSTNGGTSFTRNFGPAFTGSTSQRGRYPQGTIYNPTGNTIPANAFVSVHGAVTDGTNWVAYGRGSAPLTTGAGVQNLDLFSNGLTGLIPYSMYQTEQGVNWIVDFSFDGTDYTDTIYLRKGVWNTTNMDYDYTTQRLFAPMSVNLGGAKQLSALSVAFSPDGQTGYIVALGHDSYTFQADSSLYPIVWKTTNGGNSWNAPERVDLDNQSFIEPILNLGTSYTTGFEVDCSVDAAGMLHMVLAIGGSADGFSIASNPGSWGIFHIRSTSTSGVYNATLLGKPMTFRGTFVGTQNVSEDSRPQVCTNWAGDRMFFSWFDTDTNLFPGAGNVNPNQLLIGFNTTNNNYSTVVNTTVGTCDEGAVNFGVVSQYALPAPNNCWVIPAAYQKIQTGTDPTTPVDYFYLHNASICDNQIIGVNETKNNLFYVGQNMPNPTNGNTQIEINMTKSAQVTISVTNILGEVISVVSNELTAGNNLVTINAANYSKGVYFYTVTAGGFSVSKKMIVE